MFSIIKFINNIKELKISTLDKKSKGILIVGNSLFASFIYKYLYKYNKKLTYRMVDHKGGGKNLFALYDYNVPMTDYVLVTNLFNAKKIKKRLKRYISTPVISLYDLFDLDICTLKGIQVKNYQYYATLRGNNIISELCEWYKCKTGKLLDINNPKTYNEKIQWSKLYDNYPLKTKLSDKLLVRSYVSTKIGDKYLVKLYATWDNANEIDFNRLPRRFVLKCNHGCGMNIIVLNKNNINEKKIINKLNHWLTVDYTYVSGFEFQYHNIKRKILCEEYICNSLNDLYDYKFWCFNGKVHFIQFISNRSKRLKMAFYNRNWEKLNFYYNYTLDENIIDKPNNLDEMIYVAEKLSESFKHVRVDLYRLNNGKIYVGEMTFSSFSGVCSWQPDEIDAYLGSLF